MSSNVVWRAWSSVAVLAFAGCSSSERDASKSIMRSDGSFEPEWVGTYNGGGMDNWRTVEVPDRGPVLYTTTGMGFRSTVRKGHVEGRRLLIDGDAAHPNDPITTLVFISIGKSHYVAEERSMNFTCEEIAQQTGPSNACAYPRRGDPPADYSGVIDVPAPWNAHTHIPNLTAKLISIDDWTESTGKHGNRLFAQRARFDIGSRQGAYVDMPLYTVDDPKCILYDVESVDASSCIGVRWEDAKEPLSPSIGAQLCTHQPPR